MGIEAVGLKLDHRHGDVGAMVGNTLVICEKIVKDKPHGERAGAVLQTDDVVELEFVAQSVDRILERLDAKRHFEIVSDERADGKRHDLAHRNAEHVQLALRGVAEADVLFVDFARDLGEIHCVVADAFKITDGMQELGDLLVLRLRKLAPGEFNEICAEMILVLVDGVLHVRDLLEALLGEMLHKLKRGDEVVLRAQRHGVDRQAALLDGERGVDEKALFQPFDARGELVVFFRGLFGNELSGERLELAQKREEDQNRADTEERVDHRNADRTERGFHEREGEKGVDAIEEHRENDGAENAGEKIDERGTPPVAVCADGGDEHRHRRADAHAHDHRKRRCKRDRPGNGERLQNTDGGGVRLQNGGDERADENAEDRIFKHRHQPEKALALAQRRHCAAHRVHAVHQNGKAEQNIAGVPILRRFPEHPQQDTGDGGEGRDRRGTQKRERVAAADIRKAENPARYGCADVRAEHDADRLRESHHAGVYKADDHRGRGRRGLDHGGDGSAEQHALERRIGEPVEDEFEPLPGDELQAVAHKPHAEKKQRHAAEQRQKVGNTHSHRFLYKVIKLKYPYISVPRAG